MTRHKSSRPLNSEWPQLCPTLDVDPQLGKQEMEPALHSGWMRSSVKVKHGVARACALPLMTQSRLSRGCASPERALVTCVAWTLSHSVIRSMFLLAACPAARGPSSCRPQQRCPVPHSLP